MKVKSIVVRRGETVFEKMELGFVTSARAMAPDLEPLPEPTIAEMLGHAGTALATWAARGMKIAPAEVRQERYAICASCKFWDAKARLGLGKCRHHECGCTKLKHALATESCPDGKWEALPR